MLIGGVAALAMLVGIVAFQEYAPRYSPNTYENALILYDEGNFRAAIIALKSVLKRDRDDLSSRILIGQAYLKIGYAAAAEQELRRARLDGADEAVVNVPLATAYLQQGEYDELFREIPTDVRDPHLRGEFLVLHGKAYVQQRKLDKAEAAFKEAEGLNSDDIEPRLGMARVMLYRGRYAEAEDLADAVTDESPQSAEAWFIKSEVHRARRDFDGALEYYKKATDVDPQHVTARLARAATLIDLGKDERALEDLRQVWAVRPEDPQAYYLYALLLSKSGRMDEAQDMLERAEMALMRSSTDFVLRHPPSLLLLGVIYYQNQKYDKAYDMLDRYVRLEPYHAGARKLLGSILLKRDLGHAAIKMLSPLLDVAPDDPELLMLLSNAYTKSRQPEQAAKLLERAAVLAPTRPEIRTQLALSRLAEGREAEAVDELESALSLGGHSAKAGTLLGLVQLRQGDLDAALDTARTLIEHQPDSPAGHNLAGVVHLARHRLLEARKSFERALEIDPSFKTARHNLAKLDIRDGNIDAAKARYREILERDPTDLQSMEELAGFYRDEQRLPEAIQWLEKARAVDPKALGPQFDLMELYLRSGDEAKAKRLVGQLEERFPKSIAVRVARGRVELASGDRSSAASTFRALSHDAADSADRLFRVAKYQLASNDAQGAYGSLEQVLAKDPDFLPAQAAIIELDVRAGRLDSALRRARAIRENRPDLSLGDLLDGDVLMHDGEGAGGGTSLRRRARQGAELEACGALLPRPLGKRGTRHRPVGSGEVGGIARR